jgi:hypothetical protein
LFHFFTEITHLIKEDIKYNKIEKTIVTIKEIRGRMHKINPYKKCIFHKKRKR